MVRDIDFTFNYHKKTLNDINGYYNYNVTGTLVAYKDNVKDVVWKNNYTIIDNKAELLNENYLRDIKINDGFKLDYNYYKNYTIKNWNYASDTEDSDDDIDYIDDI